MLSNAKVGDVVFSTKSGWMEVISVKEIGYVAYPIECVSLNDREGQESFTMEGKNLYRDTAPSAWLEKDVPSFYTERFPKPKKKVLKDVTRYINVYPANGSFAYPTEEQARRNAEDHAIAIAVKVTGTYEVEE